MNPISLTKNLINQLPYIRGLYHNALKYKEFRSNSCYPAGHYYSPIVSMKEIERRESDIWNEAIRDGLPGIDLRTEEQINLIHGLSDYYDEIPFKAEKQPHLRYHFNNPFYSYTDGIVLYTMIRHLKPKRIIEIGSGFSSAVMLDTNELFFDKQISLTFIEPYPERLHSLLTPDDQKSVSILQSDVQSVSPDIFDQLRAGDMLFIDSSHIVKTGSDVHFILFEILPLIRQGVYIHFHDIFYPFEYPKEWVFEGRNWNENYFLRAFLMHNSAYEIRIFSNYIHRFHNDAFRDMPLSYQNTGGNIWIEKV